MTDPLGICGRIIDEYNVDSYINEGAFGLVYQATHIDSGTRVAIKLLKPGAGLQAMAEFENEGAALVSLTGATRVVDLLDSGETSISLGGPGGSAFPFRLPYHVLEYASGCLDELVIDPARLDWPARLSLFRDVVLGVHQMHLGGNVHRDLKSANVLLFEKSGRLTAKVADLGRSRRLSKAPLASPEDYSFGRGDPNFSPPELLFGAGVDDPTAHRAVDLYGLGSLLFELTLGQGISAVSIYPQASVVVPFRSMSIDERRRRYPARLSEVRGWYSGAFDLFSSVTPAALRQPADRLLRQLCDPDPSVRFPRVAVGRRGAPQNELLWLLAKVDSLQRSLRHDLLSSPTTRRGRKRP